MQVFEVFTYNLKNIKFKDTKAFFDNLLKSLNLNYSDIIFCFNSDFEGKNCEKAVKQFPQLSEYVQHLDTSARYFNSSPDNCFSSIKNNNGKIEKYIKAEHKDVFSALLQKIPRSINFGFMGVLLDNINWYKDEYQKPVFCSHSQKIDYYNHQFNAYFSNSIRFFKEFDFGNKLNLVQIVIERKISEDALEQYPEVFNQLLLSLGAPMQSRLECVFSQEENQKWLNASNTFTSFVKEQKSEYGSFQNSDSINFDEEYLINSVTPISGFSPKAIFTKIAKANGFKYCFYKNGCYRYQFKNSYNHIFTVDLMNIPFSSFFEASIRIYGYNFAHTVCDVQRKAIKDALNAEAYAQQVFSAATKIKNEYSEKLLLLYGHTPKWYIK